MCARSSRLFVSMLFLFAVACGTDDPGKGNNGSTNNDTTPVNVETNNDTTTDTNNDTTTDTNNDTSSTNNDTSSTNNDTSSTNNGTSSTNNGTGNTNNGTGSTNNGTGNTNNNTNGTNNQTNNQPDCNAAGDACSAGNAINAGFVCVEDVCRVECDPTAPIYPCPTSEACIAASMGGPTYCQPSECTGWLDDVSCDAGEKCFPFENDANICVAEGAGAEGDACMDVGSCAAGLICAFGECQPLCGSDADCDQAGGERCVGDTEPTLLEAGVGVCEVGCDSYVTGQCPAGQGCFPVTSEDGICDDAGTTAAYQACTDPADCGDSTTCVTFQAEDAANNIPQVARCLPFCDASAATQTQANATCPGDAFCLDLSNGNPTPSSGVCFEQCTDSDAYGTDACSGPSDFCTPQATRDAHLCFPGGPNAAGQPCDPDDSTDGCDGTSFCQALGDGTGMCEPYCQPTTQSNSNLGCENAEACRQVGDDTLNIGRCELQCTPDADFADTTCPANLQTCHPPNLGEQAYCSASGSDAIGDACEVLTSSCQPGDSCVNAFGRRVEGDAFADGTCAASCATFGDGSECGANEVCALNWFTLNNAVGHCMAPDVDAANCAADFEVCGDHSICLNSGAGFDCTELCDLDDAQCSNGTCQQLFSNPDIRIGGCL